MCGGKVPEDGDPANHSSIKPVLSGQRGHLFPPVFSEYRGSLISNTCNISLAWKCMHIELKTPRTGTLPLALQPS